MDTSKTKDVLRKLNIFKDYSSLALPVVIAVAAILFFVIAEVVNNKLRKHIESESITNLGDKVKTLTKTAVSAKQWTREQQYQQAYKADAEQIGLLARQSSQRPLLNDKIFPEPKDTSRLIFEEFGSRFREALDGLIEQVNGGLCPTEVELEMNLQKPVSSGLRSSPRGRQASLPARRALLPGRSAPSPGRRSEFGIVRRPSSQRSTSRRPLRRRPTSRRAYGNVDERETIITDVLCLEKAESASVYVDPADLSGYEFWKEYRYYDVATEEAIKDCWYYQLSYWIMEDVFDTVGSINSASDSVFTSPVKRVLSVGFSKGQSRSMSSYRATARTTGRTTATDEPQYVVSPENALVKSWTTRQCNSDIDVVHFNLAVVVSRKAGLSFMEQLCSGKEHEFKGYLTEESQAKKLKHNQITILQSNISPVDPEEESHRLYRYGDDAVVRLDLVCEYIFKRAGYDEIKPQSIKELTMDPMEKARMATLAGRVAGASRQPAKTAAGRPGKTRSSTDRRTEEITGDRPE